MKRFIIIIFILLLALVFTVFLQTKFKEASKMKASMDLPSEINGYKAQDIKLDDKVYAILETDQVIMRRYEKQDAAPIIFYFVFSPNRARASDPPEVCLIGEGNMIQEKTTTGLIIASEGKDFKLRVNKLIVEKDGRKELVLYWYYAGSEVTHDYFRHQAKLLFKNLLFQSPGCGMVRLYIPILGGDENSAMEALNEFLNAVFPHISKNLSR
ncbi:MAG: EpsI family protein [Candidatus Omnitrophica bacterium]|nr:EpsI family protein [Candidatus Omnitrophota bacterium]